MREEPKDRRKAFLRPQQRRVQHAILLVDRVQLRQHPLGIVLLAAFGEDLLISTS
jgi:hypothetical protein